MKIGLITTINTNIGDDFIREGILNALKHAKPDSQFHFILINKHNPWDLYPKWHPIKWSKFISKKRHLFSKVISRLSSWTGCSILDDCDMIIQCGAPVYWYGCNKAEWAEIFWNGIASRLRQKIHILNLAAGSCYPWESIPNSVSCKKDSKYMKSLFDICGKTIVRDSKSFQLLQSLGCSPIKLPCSAFLASLPYNALKHTDEYIFINYMPGGGHFDFNQGIDAENWKNVIKTFVESSSKDHRLAFLCHNQNEYDAAKEIAPNIECFLPKTVKEYFELAVRGKVGIFNRMHASIGFAGLGIPSVAIGADTRMLMVEDIGLQTRYVKDVTTEILLKDLNTLLAEKDKEKIRLLSLQRKTLKNYISELESFFI